MSEANLPAFPRPLSRLSREEVSHDQDGMSLRDYFAAAALTGLVANSGCRGAESDYHDRRAADAYRCADAMLAARARAYCALTPDTRHLTPDTQ